MSAEVKRILIANRGEVAIRIARAVNELGHTSIGLWTDNEIHAAHLAFCKEWVNLPGSGNRETFLNSEKIISLCLEHKVDAVHPGYGFLSENANFAKALKENGIVFIGPNPDAILKMGDKAVSKKIAQEAGVPVVPGSVGEVETIAEAIKIAGKIKYPILLKAVAGGGGRGMRICINEDEIKKNFEAVQRESLAAFGNGGLLVEKFIVNPRHIEVQILSDKKGNIFHCFERECSVQRRHQKIIEEAPSPFIGDDEKLRNQICEIAVKLAASVKYDSAGTVEFIMGEDKSFYFLEMNTRIQVEHPITEEVIGIDLLVCMIQAALGEKMGIPNQEFIKRSGHAIECRICAEDPVTMLPAPGKVSGLDITFPQGVRFDHCLYKGLEVTTDFDPMVGKLITKGINRKVALRKMRHALKGCSISGLKTNIPLHSVIMNHPKFIAGNYTTKFIEDEKPQDLISTEVDLDFIIEKISSIEAYKMGLA
ncbi:MAG: ATP-grasp domain-containing protein [Bacteriovoracaceae bacterium]|jgi:acetyl-CoA carboxylase, biotin carboxylase subunit|nr:ATP-grasp domain-containing protein [Bacteriovoracaceae bacterium]